MSQDEKHFCTCPAETCPHHPNCHQMGCDPCIKKNLSDGEVPACFWMSISDNFDGVTEYATESFVRFFLKHKGNPVFKVKVIQDHAGEGQFPTFAKGTPVKVLGDECVEFAHWFPCEIEGHQTYVAESFLVDGVLSREYNPTELVQEIGDVLTINEVVFAWLVATNESGQTGWIPAETVVSC